MTNKNKIRKIVFGNLDKIYTTSRDIAKEWGLDAIPLTTFKVIIDKSRPKTEESALKEFNIVYNKTLDLIYKTGKDKTKEMKSENISIKYIKVLIDHVKANMGI